MSERPCPVNLPEALDRAIDVLGNRVKIAALLALREGGATGTELAARLGVSQVLVRYHLVALERLGILTVQPPRTEVDVRRRYFYVNHCALARVVDALNVVVASTSK
ncbi:ArsR/SmtB family transcription factor [Rathayibacter agropyri]|uniref:ArsR/SmtB family transcription factor n=1 Tax=Rathayibacter agropyri TaxID=1634927 RepID=UPI0015643073|nr:winged helix-turn-helix domain-containing protein [Rathayibacter agropyri]NRD09310.1 winged helix-turn-helix transcriptional regulator [Rathayibacter agropyri]